MIAVARYETAVCTRVVLVDDGRKLEIFGVAFFLGEASTVEQRVFEQCTDEAVRRFERNLGAVRFTGQCVSVTRLLPLADRLTCPSPPSSTVSPPASRRPCHC